MRVQTGVMRSLRLLGVSALLLAGAPVAPGGTTGAGAATTPAGIRAHSGRSTAVNASEWTTYNQNGLRTGIDASGSSFSPVKLAWASPDFDGQIYGQPLVAAGRVYAATENDTVYALAADTGGVLWSTHVGTAFDPSTVPGLCGDISPTVGITSTPVIDTARSEIFVVATEQVRGDASHHLIGMNLYSGAIVLNESIDPAGFDPAHELQRASLALTAGRVIIGFGGNDGDCEPYHGLVVSAPEDGSAPSHFVVASLPGDSEGAVWMGGGAPAVDASGNVWVSTGNSQYESSTDTYDNSDGVLELSPTMHLLQAFAPTTWYSDNASDLDLSTPPVIVGNGLVFAIGKSSTAFVLDQEHLGGVGGELISRASCFGHGAAAHVGDIVYTGCGGGAEALRVSNHPAALTTLWSSAPVGVVRRSWPGASCGPSAAAISTSSTPATDPRSRNSIWAPRRHPSRHHPRLMASFWPPPRIPSGRSPAPQDCPDLLLLPRATGASLPTGASSPSVTPISTDRPEPSTSTSRSWAWPRRPTARLLAGGQRRGHLLLR